jgi:pimeloyl-ACP methyl ester carboxylesterase
MLSLAHPRLLSTLVLIEPIIAASSIQESGPGLVQMTLRRKTTWPSRLTAEKTFAKAFKSWDPRALQSFYNHALYPYPSSSNSDNEIPTRVVTGRYQELGGVVRPSYIYDGNFTPAEMPWVEEALVVHDLIPFVPCSAFYICGALSASSLAEVRADWMARTGVGKHMGRARERRVQVAVVPDVGHLVPMEAPTACAKAAAEWIDQEIGGLENKDKKLAGWRYSTLEEKEKLAEKWMASVKAKI